MNEELIFERAIKLSSGEREPYLATVCGDDQQLRQRIDRLIAAHESPDSFLPVDPVPQTADWSTSTESIDQMVGPYKLREQIGVGGMGVVFVAEQERPVRRKVALKIIKAGMDTKEVVARFSAERQALALMDHPSIAKVFDAGCTESGRPYFVMELVRGIPITDYCDKKKLTVSERLKLFVQVCAAIQHAHHKGVIHRDIKPSNVMVTEHDGRPVPKVIDFGVAKATNQRLAEQTIYTRFQQIIGTPMYMSPEQAELSGLDIDTRCDVYSLGVLLYELITGVPPFEKEVFEQATYDELRRIIREQEPRTPSVRLTTLGGMATTIAQDRGTDPDRLWRQISGDLDWIVVKAMEKDRTRRYEGASRLADDVERYLNDEIVEARSPNTYYRLRKFIRRNKAAVSTAAIIFTALTVGLGSALFGLHQARTEAKRALVAETDATRTLETLGDVVFEEAMSSALGGNTERTSQLVEIGKTAQLTPDQLALIEATLALVTYKPDRAIELLENIAGSNRENASVIGLLSVAHMWAGHDSEGLHYLEIVKQIEPTTAEDYLFKGIAETDPSVGLPWIEKAIAMRPSAGALTFRARARYCVAVQTQNATYAESALEDGQAAQLLLGETSGALTNQLVCHYFLANHLDSPDRMKHARKARGAAEALLKRGDDLGNWFSALYFTDVDELTLALKAWNQVDLRGRVLSQYVAALLHRACDDAEEALSRFEEMIPDASNPYVLLSRARLLAETKTERGELAELLPRIEEAAEASPQQKYLALGMYVLMGDHAGHMRRAKALCEAGTTAYQHWGMGHAVSFLAGECTDERIEEAEQAVRGSNYDECVLHLAIGERLLVLGQRQKAKAQFEKCVDTGVWEFFEYNWARAYLVRMEADPNWPHWLPANEPHQQDAE